MIYSVTIAETLWAGEIDFLEAGVKKVVLEMQPRLTWKSGCLYGGELLLLVEDIS